MFIPAIAELASQCAQVFRDNLEAIEEGTFSCSLIDQVPSADDYKKLKAAKQITVTKPAAPIIAGDRPSCQRYG